MSDDSYTEVTSESWFGRLGKAVTGVIFGAFVFVLAFPVLFWNEGRSVRAYRSLEEGKASAVSASADKVDGENSGRLVHVSGRAETPAQLRDPLFDVSANSLRLRRVVEMYQWKETTETEERKKLGGGKETTTTYNYSRVWSEEPIDSQRFKKSAEHQNPSSWPCRSEDWEAETVSLGAYTLPSSLVRRINSFTGLPVPSGAQASVSGFRAEDGAFVRGANMSSPNVGDMRVTFLTVYSTEISVMARQVGSTFEPFSAKAGGTIELLQTGRHSVDDMIRTAEQENSVMTWVLRAVGCLMMFLGLALVLNPLSVLGDVIPLVGSIIGFGTGLVSFIAAASFSLATIALAWIFYRPLVGIALLAAAVGLIVLVRRLKTTKTT